MADFDEYVEPSSYEEVRYLSPHRHPALGR